MTLGKAEQPTKVILSDGKEYSLVPLNLNIMCDLEEQFEGKPFSELFREGSVKPLRYIFWLRLKAEHPEIKLEEAGKLITTKSMASLTKDIEDQLGIKED